MFYTDGKLLVHKDSDVEELLEVKVRIEKYFELELGQVFDLELSESTEFPALVLPKGIEYKDLYNCLVPGIAFRAINSNLLEQPDTEIVEVKHIFSDEDINLKAGDQTQRIIKLNKLKIEKASIMKRFNADIAEVEEEINNEAEVMAQGYEYIDKLCKKVLDFEDNKVLFYSVNEEDVLVKTRDMNNHDKQLQLFVKPVENWKDHLESNEEESEEIPEENEEEVDTLEESESTEENSEEEPEEDETPNW